MSNFSEFTNNQVLADPLANLTADRLVDLIKKKFIGTDALHLTGTVAKIMQADPVTPIKTTSFITTNKDVLPYAASDLVRALGAKGALRFVDRVQLVFDDSIYLEVWYSDNIGNVVTVDNIDQQAKANIPNYIN